ncbi:MAG: bifunctional O-acetylhomoserine aminocarboxypropyltransferase/cysteine synthase [Proteobacteria bacterium]|nr:bifunctional O-acetylhomoserine aminocarboxypropyltransferase/cysteine synthase [Pseudomonadota bacterium]
MSHPHLETLAIHAGQKADPVTGSVVMPIYQTAGYQFDSASHANDLFLLQDPKGKHGNVYSRMGNPTVDNFEARMTALDGGVGAVALASGMTAVSYAVLNVCRAGDNFVTSRNLYGGVSNLFQNIFRDFGIEARFVDHDDPENFRKAVDDKTRLFWGETLPNPGLNVFPVGEVAKIGNELGVPLMIDNTCATPILCRPFDHGAHITVYSATKYIGGHGSSIGGVVVDSGRFDWAKHAKRFPMLNEPDPSYHGIEWTKKFGNIAYILKLRATMLRDLGGCMAPMNGFLFNQGLETLSLRMKKHCDNASQVARYLANHPKVNFVRYPGLSEGNEKKWADAYLGGMYGPMVGVDIKGGVPGGQKFVEGLKMFYHVANIGDTRSMAIHPASTTHSQVPSDMRQKAGITDGYVRMCIGIEHIDDILADMDASLAKL